VSRDERGGVAIVGAGGWGKNHVRNYAAISAIVVATDQKLAVFDKGAEPLRRASPAFLDVVRTRNAPSGDLQYGLDVVCALEGGASSLAQGGARIELARER
jgi:hypothetical protein